MYTLGWFPSRWSDVDDTPEDIFLFYLAIRAKADEIAATKPKRN